MNYENPILKNHTKIFECGGTRTILNTYYFNYMFILTLKIQHKFHKNPTKFSDFN